MFDHTDVVDESTEAVRRTPTARALLVLDGDHLEQLAVRGSDDADHNPRLKRLTRPHVQKGVDDEEGRMVMGCPRRRLGGVQEHVLSFRFPSHTVFQAPKRDT